jgi:hypothetical protein
MLSELQGKWDALQSKGDFAENDLKQLLAECIHAGKFISDPVDRANLQWIARKIGDAIFRVAKEYPSTAILPVESTQQQAISRKPISYNVPALPPKYLQRKEVLKRLKEKILDAPGQKMGTIGSQPPIGLVGMGGVGKSVLAIAIARDDEVRGKFPDGVIWLTLGKNVTVTEKQIELIQVLGLPPMNFKNWEEGRAQLSMLTVERAYLIILHDVWEETDAEAFTRLGTGCRLLVTTRNRRVLEKIGAEVFQLDVLTPQEALELLTSHVEQPIEALPPEAVEVAKFCGYLPLALASFGSLIRTGRFTWQDEVKHFSDSER